MIQQKPELESEICKEEVEGSVGGKRRSRRGKVVGEGGRVVLREEDFSGLRAPSASGKNYVLDTNVLLHDPGCLQRFADNHVCVPVDVLAELDRFKNEQSDRGANARAVHRSLMALFGGDPRTVTEGVVTEGEGTVRLVVFDPGLEGMQSGALRRFHRVFPEVTRIDHRILACVLMLMESNETPVVLVTKDLNMHLKAKALGIECQDYLNDKVDAHDVSSYDLLRVDVGPDELQRLASSGVLEMESGRLEGVSVNQYILLQVGGKQTMPARLGEGGGLHRLHVPDALRIPNGQHIKPLNLGQQCFMDAMLNPEISLVTCYGQAGTGKTLLAVATGLAEVFSRAYAGLTVSRPIVAMGDTVGFLPGTLEEKMNPWLQPIYDALELVLRADKPSGPRRKQGKSDHYSVPAGAQKVYEPLLQEGVVEIEALCYIRGRSIPNRFFVLDEAQQLTPLEAKTVVTRMSRGSKLILVGDPAQIDNPYVDSRSNGLVYTRKRMRGQPFAAHVCLSRGERSELAEAGARLM